MWDSMEQLLSSIFQKQQAFAYRLLEALFKQYRQTKATTTDHQAQVDTFYHK